MILYRYSVEKLLLQALKAQEKSVMNIGNSNDEIVPLLSVFQVIHSFVCKKNK